MGIIKKAVEGAIHGVEHIVHGAEHAIGGAFSAAGDVLTGHLGRAGRHLRGAVDGVGEMARGAAAVSPVGLAVNSLTDNAMDKLVGGATKIGSRAVGAVVSAVPDGIDQAANGLKTMAGGLVEGDLSKMGSGLLNVGLGGLSVAAVTDPVGIAFTAGAGAVGLTKHES